MRPPKYITEPEALAHWKRHSKACVENGSLTDQTADSFALVCRVWGIIQTTDPHADSKSAMKFCGLVKHYQSLAKPFGLLGVKPPVKPQKSIGDVIQEALRHAE